MTDKVLIAADLTSNHMGDMDYAKKMIDAAADAGVDIVKTQSWQADKLSKDFHGDYQATYDRHKKTELSNDQHHELMAHCRSRGVTFLTTCFDLDRVSFLASLGLNTIKVASSDCTSFSLLKKLMDNFETLIVSTGMTTDEEIVKTIRYLGDHNYILLHCVSIYPTPLDKCNLNRINWLRDQGARRVGFSDHSLGTAAAKAAMSMGIELVEKHLSLDRSLPGKDQSMSTTPEEFAEICRWRDTCALMMGESNPSLTEDESALRPIYIGKWGNNK